MWHIVRAAPNIRFVFGLIIHLFKYSDSSTDSNSVELCFSISVVQMIGENGHKNWLSLLFIAEWQHSAINRAAIGCCRFNRHHSICKLATDESWIPIFGQTVKITIRHSSNLHDTSNDKQILHGDQTRREENFYTVDHECWRAISLQQLTFLFT